MEDQLIFLCRLYFLAGGGVLAYPRKASLDAKHFSTGEVHDLLYI